MSQTTEARDEGPHEFIQHNMQHLEVWLGKHDWFEIFREERGVSTLVTERRCTYLSPMGLICRVTYHITGTGGDTTGIVAAISTE